MARLHGLVLVAAICLTVTLMVAVLAIRFPATQPRAHSDAVVILASEGGVASLEQVKHWAELGVPILVSGTPTSVSHTIRETYEAACSPSTYDIICLDPTPATTQGEARMLASVARSRGWKSVSIVTHVSHITRSRILARRCFDGGIHMVAVDVQRGEREWIRATVYEIGALVKTWATPEC